MSTSDQSLDLRSFALTVAVVPYDSIGMRLYRLRDACPECHDLRMGICNCKAVRCDVAYRPTQHEFLFC